MLLRLMQMSATADGPAARSAPVATILPGDASATLAAVVIIPTLFAAPRPNLQLPLLLQLLLHHHYYHNSWCLHHHQAGPAACNAIGGIIPSGNAGAIHAGNDIWQWWRAP